MSQYKTVLVALDIYSEHQKVLARAKGMAANVENISLVHVTLPHMYFESYGYAMGNDFVQDNQTKAKNTLMELAKLHNIPEQQVYVPMGNAADEIHDVAEKINADLIIIGTHGQSGLKLLLGSTANAVLHGVKCDVLAVRV